MNPGYPALQPDEFLIGYEKDSNWQPQDEHDPQTGGREQEEPAYNIYDALFAVWQEVGTVAKDGTNDFHHYRYASEAQTIATIRPALIRHSILALPSFELLGGVDQFGNTFINATVRFYHVPSRTSHIMHIPGAGNDRNKQGGVGDKGLYKSITGAIKYALFKTFLIETREDPEVPNEVDMLAGPSYGVGQYGPGQTGAIAGQIGMVETGRQPLQMPPPRQSSPSDMLQQQQAQAAQLQAQTKESPLAATIAEISMAVQQAQTIDQLGNIWEHYSSALATIWNSNPNAHRVLEERFKTKAAILQQQ